MSETSGFLAKEKPDGLCISPDSSLTQARPNGSSADLSHDHLHVGEESLEKDGHVQISSADFPTNKAQCARGASTDDPRIDGRTASNISPEERINSEGRREKTTKEQASNYLPQSNEKTTTSASQKQSNIASDSACLKDEDGHHKKNKSAVVVKGKVEQKLNKMLKRIASKDILYGGLAMSPSSNDDSSLPSFPSLSSSSSSQPTSLILGPSCPDDEPLIEFLTRTISKDGKPGGESGTQHCPAGGVWTLRAQEGTLYLFNNKTAGKMDDGDEKEEEDESEDEETEGIELSKIIEQDSDQENCKDYFHHFNIPDPTMVVFIEIDNPHVTPLYSPSELNKYEICTDRVSGGEDTEFILHYDAVFLVLEEDLKNNKAKINAIPKGKLMTLLQKIEKEGNDSSGVHYNPVVNIQFELGKKGNNMAFFFNGQAYRYYVHVDNTTKELVAVQAQYSMDVLEWLSHLQFTYNYHTSGPRCGASTSSTASIETDFNDSGQPEEKKKHMEVINESEEPLQESNVEEMDGEGILKSCRKEEKSEKSTNDVDKIKGKNFEREVNEVKEGKVAANENDFGKKVNGNGEKEEKELGLLL